MIDNSREAVYGYDQRVEILGGQGAVQTDNNYPNAAIISGADRVSRDLPLNFFMERYTDSFLAENERVCRGRSRGRPGAGDGSRTRARHC